jgi:hypothetical protein
MTGVGVIVARATTGGGVGVVGDEAAVLPGDAVAVVRADDDDDGANVRRATRRCWIEACGELVVVGDDVVVGEDAAAPVARPRRPVGDVLFAAGGGAGLRRFMTVLYSACDRLAVCKIDVMVEEVGLRALLKPSASQGCWVENWRILRRVEIK